VRARPQWVVNGLERGIELLGQEPERRWEALAGLGRDALGRAGASPAALAKRARALADRGDLEKALRLYIRVLEAEPDDTASMDAAAEILAELGDGEGARELVLKSIQVAPETGAGKYVLLGHLEHGRAAIEAFESGLAILTRDHDRLEEADGEGGRAGEEAAARARALKKQMSSALTAIAKVYLTDCLSDCNSEEICEKILDKALLHDPENPEACQSLADLRLSQGRKGEALALVRRTVDLCESLPEGLIPSYDFRAVTARLLVELSEYKLAVAILNELTGEDNEDTEVWYLLGLCHMLRRNPKLCREALNRAKLLLEQSGSVDTHLLEQINSLLARRAVAESEKEKFWNPRWWLQGDYAARPAAPEDAKAGVEFAVSLPAVAVKKPHETLSGLDLTPQAHRLPV